MRLAFASLLCTCLLLACSKDEAAKPREDAPPSTLPTPPGDAGAKTAAPKVSDSAEVRDRLLAWLDPEAVSVGYLRASTPLRGEAVAVVFGLPPRAEDLLQAVGDVDQALEAVRPTDAPEAETWLGPQALISTGRFSRKPTVLRPLLRPREEVIERLEALELRHHEIEPFDVWEPDRVFPYRVVLFDNQVAAFISMNEAGSGLPPLASARDMPPSDVEQQLSALLAEPQGPAVALFAAGPMLHFDLAASVLAVRFEMLEMGDGSFDGQVVLQIDGDPNEAAATLDARTAPEQNDGLRELVERTAFAPEAGVVTGRLQLSPADADRLRRKD